MRFSLATAAALAPVLFAAAEDHLILVGANGQLAFSPPNITAAVGDTVSFQFQAKNHSVTQSTFATPCQIQTTPAEGIDSGFQFVNSTAATLPQWSFTVNNASTPLWFFCAQTGHCQAGMVFAVNANPNSNKSFAIYQQAAMASPAVAASASSGAATSAAGGDPAATGVAGASTTDGAAGASPTDGNAINSAADTGAPLTNAGAAPTAAAAAGSSNSTTPPNAGFRLSGNTFSLVAAVGLTAMLL